MYVKMYDDGFPAMRPRVEEFSQKIVQRLNESGELELICADICRTEPEFMGAVELFEQAGAECIITLHLAYSPSLESIGALTKTGLPVVALDTTPDHDFTDSDDGSVITYNHGIHGVMDMCNLLVRQGKIFFVEAGHCEKSDVIARVIKRVRGFAAANAFRRSRVGVIGELYPGMGDFRLPDTTFAALGIERIWLGGEQAAALAAGVTDGDAQALIDADRKKYIISPDIPQGDLLSNAKGSLALRRWAEDNSLTAFTANFLSVTKAYGLGGMPFAEINRAMERGIGYAGEGDVLTAALTGALMRVSDEVSFTEIFCPDWQNGTLFLSHMGEMNTALSADTPRLLPKRMRYSDTDTLWLCGTYKEGRAILADLAPVSDTALRLIAIKGQTVLPACPKLIGKNICGWFKPDAAIEDLLSRYSRLGGTHHLALICGDECRTLEAFAEAMGFEYKEL